jgi:hypothetical protein
MAIPKHSLLEYEPFEVIRLSVVGTIRQALRLHHAMMRRSGNRNIMWHRIDYHIALLCPSYPLAVF